MLSDLDSLEKRKVSIEKKAKSGDKEAKVTLAIITKIIENLENGIPARETTFSKEERPWPGGTKLHDPPKLCDKKSVGN